MKALSFRLAWLGRLFRRKAPPTASEAQPRPFLVLVAPLAGDAEGEAAGRLIQALSGRKGLLARQVPAEVAPEPPQSAGALAAATVWARQVLLDAAGDVMIWGGVVGRALSLQLTARGGDEPRLPGPSLDLPAAVEGPAADLLHCAVLAALDPPGEAQRRLADELLIAAAVALDGAAKKPPPGFTPRQQALLLAVQAQLALAMAALEPQGEWLTRAEAACTAALQRLPVRERQPFDLPPLARLSALVLQARAERSNADADHEAALAAWRAALAEFPREAFPMEWAGEQARLGAALYRFDLRTGRTDLLKEAIGCLQAALPAFGRQEHPRRRAELTMDLAQALLVYGDAVDSVEVLDKAAAACRAVLEMRPRETDPAGWAAAMHGLGTALFLRDKHADSGEQLDEAAETLRQAAEAYRGLGLERLAGLSEKHIAHVERLVKARQEREERRRRRGRFDWSEMRDDD